MFNLIKKDFLSLSKSKSDLIELLLMPLILIVILGFTLGDILMGDFNVSTFNVGVVNNQNFAADLNRLEDDLLEEGMSEEAVGELIASTKETDPASMLIDLLTGEEFKDLMVVQGFEDAQSAQKMMEEDELAGYITIPEEFSYEVWQSIYFDEDPSATLEVTGQGEGVVSSSILQSVVHSFSDEYNLEASIALATDGEAEVEEDERDYGKITQLSVEEPVDAFQYYTIGMGVMFALSTASALASRAFREKEQHVFGRIMLSGTKPLTYLSSKMISGTLITFVQLSVLFTFSTIFFGIFDGKSTEFWMNITYVTALYSLVIGSITSLLTSISLYANDNSTVGFFSSFVSVFAFIGGSLTPVDQFSETLQRMGNWLPNGAAMTSYLQIFQGFDFQDVLPLMIRVIGVTLVCLVIAVIIFPKRRLD
ncbi:ABC transporter permease [Tetragenococcus solitarius]|uniref:ABC-2 type transporter transmembrane domain-containing protein n=1 Tax=Tetragenococcus solitarius TaxID=71453 RepID=A0ABN3YDQ1_9ENTE|nr:ABC transporter permease [Tetragenococcus solitarius]